MAVYGVDSHVGAASERQARHEATSTTATIRVTALIAVLNGTGTTIPDIGTNSASGSVTTRIGVIAVDEDGFDSHGSAAILRLQRSKFDWVTV